MPIIKWGEGEEENGSCEGPRVAINPLGGIDYKWLWWRFITIHYGKILSINIVICADLVSLPP